MTSIRPGQTNSTDEFHKCKCRWQQSCLTRSIICKASSLIIRKNASEFKDTAKLWRRTCDFTRSREFYQSAFLCWVSCDYLWPTCTLLHRLLGRCLHKLVKPQRVIKRLDATTSERQLYTPYVSWAWPDEQNPGGTVLRWYPARQASCAYGRSPGQCITGSVAKRLLGVVSSKAVPSTRSSKFDTSALQSGQESQNCVKRWQQFEV